MPVLCYKPDMRNWMRERMKRRAKKQPNESESTGKVGQELPELDPKQPAPLRRHHRTALSGTGLFHAAITPQGSTDCQNALELCRCHQSLAPRAATVDQDVPQLWV